MNAPLLPKLLLEPNSADPCVPLAHSLPPMLWQSAFGPILIEVRDGAAYVNGERVTPAAELRDFGAKG